MLAMYQGRQRGEQRARVDDYDKKDVPATVPMTRRTRRRLQRRGGRCLGPTPRRTRMLRWSQQGS